ncbi:MAG: hypothetical protein AAF514_15105 [Verrucomicrobiota bacterium]
MKACLTLLALLIAISLTLAFSLTLPLPEAATGAPHPEHTEMRQGGGSERHDGRLFLGWIYGVAQIGVFMVAIGLSIPGNRPGRWWLIPASALYLAVFSAMMLAYAKDVTEAPFVLGFPLPTALLVFGMWPASALFVVLYSMQFRSWVYSEADAKRFEEIKTQYPGGNRHGI